MRWRQVVGGFAVPLVVTGLVFGLAVLGCGCPPVWAVAAGLVGLPVATTGVARSLPCGWPAGVRWAVAVLVVVPWYVVAGYLSFYAVALAAVALFGIP